jgi:hypothetical protein
MASADLGTGCLTKMNTLDSHERCKGVNSFGVTGSRCKSVCVVYQLLQCKDGRGLFRVYVVLLMISQGKVESAIWYAVGKGVGEDRHSMTSAPPRLNFADETPKVVSTLGLRVNVLFPVTFCT